jgi:hypothetical protein
LTRERACCVVLSLLLSHLNNDVIEAKEIQINLDQSAKNSMREDIAAGRKFPMGGNRVACISWRGSLHKNLLIVQRAVAEGGVLYTQYSC